MFFPSSRTSTIRSETRAANSSFVTFPASLPTNYLQIIGTLPFFTDIEMQQIKENIKKARKRIKEAEKAFNSPANTFNSKIAASLACCLAYLDLGQQYSKKAQALFISGDTETGDAFVEYAEEKYKKIEEYKWKNCIHQVYDTGTFPITPSHSKEDALQDIFAFYRELSLLYFLKYKHRSENSNKRDFKNLLDKFLISVETALNLRPNNNDLLFIKTVFLLDFLSLPELVSSIKEKYLQAADNFLQHGQNDSKKAMIAFSHQIIQKIFSNEPVNMSYESFIPTDVSSEIRWFFANIYFEYVYGQFANTDLTIFIPGSAPEKSDETAFLALEDIGMNISIANLYKFMAHFRNITAKFQVAANPRLNADVLDALYTHGFLDAQGNIRSNLSEAEQTFFASIMQSVYQMYFSNTPVVLKDLSPTDLSQQMNDRRELLKDLYDGLSPEMALFLLSKSLDILPSFECQKADNCCSIIKSALWYRAAPVFAQAPIPLENLVDQFQSELKDGAVKMLLITCPVLKDAELEFRHSIYVIFHRISTQIKIQIVNAGLGNEQFHQNSDEKLYVRQYELNNPEESQELFKSYLTLLFNLSTKVVQTTGVFMDELANAYCFNGNEFIFTENIFPSQVAGNCTVFGAQWALRIALGLTETEHDKLMLDFAKGTDLLASKIRSHEVDEPCELIIQEGLPEDRLRFNCGYVSIPRKKFKAPSSHSTPAYASGTPGTNHHIVPQSYLQFLYDKLNTTDMDLLCDVVGKPHGTHITKKQFAYGNFDLFHGPECRSDDPKDDTTDPLHEEQGIEKEQPYGFDTNRWNALQAIGSTLRAALNTTGLSPAEETTAINNCKAQLAIIASDVTRITCFKETAAGSVWEPDPNDPTKKKYRLKTSTPALVSTITSTCSRAFGSASTISGGAIVSSTSGPGGP